MCLVLWVHIWAKSQGKRWKRGNARQQFARSDPTPKAQGCSASQSWTPCLTYVLGCNTVEQDLQDLVSPTKSFSGDVAMGKWITGAGLTESVHGYSKEMLQTPRFRPLPSSRLPESRDATLNSRWGDCRKPQWLRSPSP